MSLSSIASKWMDNSYGFEQHIAQQSRRDKLRVPQNSTPAAQRVEDFDLVRIQSLKNAVLPAGSSFVPSEMINFSIDSNVLSDQRDINMLRQELASSSHPVSSFSTSFLKNSGEICNGGYWKSPLQGGDWSSYHLGFQNEMLNQESHRHVEELHFPPPRYQNSLQDVVSLASVGTQDAEMASIVQHNSREINRRACEASGSELALLPVFKDQSNVLPFNNTDNTGWIGELGSIARKRDEELRPFISDSNPQALSLSLSSQFNEPEELQQSNSMFKNHQDSKPVKSEDFCRLPKPSIAVNSYRSSGPLGPFTGYATILKSSKFLKPAQILLDEFCGSSGSNFVKPPCEELEKASSDSAINAVSKEIKVKGISSCGQVSTFYGSNETSVSGVGSISSETHQPEYQQKNTKLLYMLDEVCRRYRQYHQQMQMVVSSFESVAGLSCATPYISLALKTVSRHFRCLKNAISEQLKHLRKVLGEGSSSPTTAGTSSSKHMEQSFQKQKSGPVNMGLLESQHVWRPQRGLPERAVAILRAWLFEHFLHPYPTDTDKHMLATQTGLSRNQVSNWFINARVRVWKPMVEEIHTLETKGFSEMNKTLQPHANGTSTMLNAGWTGREQPHKNVGGSDVSDQNVLSSVADCEMEQRWSHDKRSRTDGDLIGFMPSGAEFGELGAVALTLGLRHRVESVQQRRRQLQQQEDQVIRHYGSEMIHDFVG